MHSGAMTAVCFIGFFVLLEFARKTVKFLFPYLASYGILDLTNRNQAKRLSNSIKYLPFYYYLNLEKEYNDKLTREEIIRQVKNIKYAKKGQEYLLKRFENDNNFIHANLASDTKAGERRRFFYALLINNTPIDFNLAEVDQKILFEIIKNIEPV